jgi:hypothetical protein
MTEAIIPYNDIENLFLEGIFVSDLVFSDVICITPRANKHMKTEIDNSHFSAIGKARF